MGINEMIQYFRQISGKVGSNIYAGLQGPAAPQQMAFLRDLQKEVKQKNSLDIPLAELKVVVFDLETTGFYPENGDQIISIGAIKMTGPQIEEKETFYSLVKTEIPLSAEISKLTKITDEELQQAPLAVDVLMRFFNFIKSDVLVAHHSQHEHSFMQKASRDLLRTRFEHRILDTSFLIRLYNPLSKSQPLEEVCKECGIEITNRHHALGDAIMTAKVWGCYVNRALNTGFYNLREVYEYLSKLR